MILKMMNEDNVVKSKSSEAIRRRACGNGFVLVIIGNDTQRKKTQVLNMVINFI